MRMFLKIFLNIRREYYPFIQKTYEVNSSFEMSMSIALRHGVSLYLFIHSVHFKIEKTYS
ncbi:MAG: hypothetical protein QG627_1194 [Chlamydiota bacterium]|jgi:hypothetical protein|nr:hypothetical protein [Chlamydiota bacterium]